LAAVLDALSTTSPIISTTTTTTTATTTTTTTRPGFGGKLEKLHIGSDDGRSYMRSQDEEGLARVMNDGLLPCLIDLSLRRGVEEKGLPHVIQVLSSPLVLPLLRRLHVVVGMTGNDKEALAEALEARYTTTTTGLDHLGLSFGGCYDDCGDGSTTILPRVFTAGGGLKSITMTTEGVHKEDLDALAQWLLPYNGDDDIEGERGEDEEGFSPSPLVEEEEEEVFPVSSLEEMVVVMDGEFWIDGDSLVLPLAHATSLRRLHLRQCQVSKEEGGVVRSGASWSLNSRRRRRRRYCSQ